MLMPAEDLAMFHEEMTKLGGFMRVQSQKRWQQVVKNCGFPQTTSSSYSTRNKYESYLLAKETRDLLANVVSTRYAVSLCVCLRLILVLF